MSAQDREFPPGCLWLRGAVGYGTNGVDVVAAAFRSQRDDRLGLSLRGQFLGVGLQLTGDGGEIRAIGGCL